MVNDRFIKALRNKTKSDRNNKESIAKAISKIQGKERLSKEEFLSVYNSLWKEGPSVRYQHPDSAARYQSTKADQSP